jgi:hypothetical protein
MRLFTRRGYDWTDRYPAIAAAAVKLRARSIDSPTGRADGSGEQRGRAVTFVVVGHRSGAALFHR